MNSLKVGSRVLYAYHPCKIGTVRTIEKGITVSKNVVKVEFDDGSILERLAQSFLETSDEKD